MKKFIQDSPLRSTPATEKAATPQASTPKQLDDKHQTWRQELHRKMVEASKRMETDPVYRKQIQSMTR